MERINLNIDIRPANFQEVLNKVMEKINKREAGRNYTQKNITKNPREN